MKKCVALLSLLLLGSSVFAQEIARRDTSVARCAPPSALHEGYLVTIAGKVITVSSTIATNLCCSSWTAAKVCSGGGLYAGSANSKGPYFCCLP